MRHIAALTFVALTSLLPAKAVLAAEAAGRVLLAAGDVTATREGRVVRLERGATIEARDVLRTGRDSSLQVRMNDEAILALKSESALSVEQYTFRGQTDGSENAVFRLLKGGFRTITGLIGRVNKNAYRVNTGVATIGIRGTAFALALCEDGGCREGSGAAAKDGLYGAVTEGQINATNKAGEATFSAGQAFYAATSDTGFQQLLTPPTFLGDRLDGQRRAVNEQRRQREESDPNEPRGPRRERLRDTMTAQNDDKKTATDGSTDSTKTGTPTDTTSTTSADSTTKGSILTGTGLLPILKAEILNESGTKTILPSPDGFAVAIPLPGGNHVQHFGDADRATFNGFNQLLTWTKPSSLISGNLGGGEITQAGGIARGEQILSWGRWNGGSVTTSSGNTIHGIPLLFVTANAVNANSFPTTPPSLGVVTYDGTHGPGASAVRAGYLPNAISASITGASLTIDFLAGQASLAMSFSIGSKGNPINPAFDHTYSFSTNSIGRTGSGGSGDFSGSFTGTGTCTPSCSPLSIAGNVSIGLTGQGGYGLAVTSGGFRDSSSSLSASFIRIFEAAPVGSANNTVTTTAVAQ
jgi:hypothetical protein